MCLAPEDPLRTLHQSRRESLLPAVYTQLLPLDTGMSTAGRYAYLALYNAVYVVPLALIVAADVLTITRIAMTKRRAKILKAVSGVLLVALGVTFLVAPNLLR
jgi:cytochrome c biogenesis protein CcdA